MRFLGRSLVGLFLLALTAGLLGWAAQITYSALEDRRTRETGGPPARERVLAANVIAATPGSITPVMTAFGEVRARRVLELRAPSAGRIVELADGFEDGGTVTTGQILLRIDPSEAEADLSVARAELAGAEAELRDAERALTLARSELVGAQAQRDLQAAALRRQKDLLQRGVGSTAAVETAELSLSAAEQTILSRRGSIAQAETRIDTARLAIERARIALDNASRDLTDRTVVADFGGQLSEVSVLRGSLVSSNEKVATLIDPDDLEVIFSLSAAQHARLLDERGELIGAQIRAVLDVQGLSLAAAGTITRESATVGASQTGRRVFATLDQAKGFRPGDFLRVEVQEPAIEHAIRLPATALSPQSTVLALTEDDRLEEIAVELLRRQGDDVLVSGPLEGRDVVAERTPALGSGIKVRPLRPGAALAPPALVTLDPERRARLKAYVQANTRIPEGRKARLLPQLEDKEVPAEIVERLESRMGG
ncbi:Biotin-lipoyl like [Jannaschia faecimaris]|uniref:Biotin-lipoyl like n=1 Tax=Jannaschia faecimaris TaxID=1244108 RepID=A0A1H3QY10_9RHOB|nr:HlyD family efflux transporter periplasmic adaptor subunit [Jannaschia faecimaris]SDZ18307.1 Biotin-lipoyl like [Jannaschia faecimaris]